MNSTETQESLSNINEYQNLARRTMGESYGGTPPEDVRLISSLVRIARITSVLYGMVEKSLAQKHPFDTAKLKVTKRLLADEVVKLLEGTPGYEVNFPADKFGEFVAACGLVSEACEVLSSVVPATPTSLSELPLEMFKPASRPKDTVGELGDVQWYLANICTQEGLASGQTLQANIDKLSTRYQGEGFTPAESISRKDFGNNVFEISHTGDVFTILNDDGGAINSETELVLLIDDTKQRALFFRLVDGNYQFESNFGWKKWVAFYKLHEKRLSGQ